MYVVHIVRISVYDHHRFSMHNKFYINKLRLYFPTFFFAFIGFFVNTSSNEYFSLDHKNDNFRGNYYNFSFHFHFCFQVKFTWHRFYSIRMMMNGKLILFFLLLKWTNSGLVWWMEMAHWQSRATWHLCMQRNHMCFTF